MSRIERCLRAGDAGLFLFYTKYTFLTVDASSRDCSDTLFPFAHICPQSMETDSPSLDIHCPITATLSVLGGKWTPLVLWELRDETLRFGELKRRIPGITKKMLSQRLQELEDRGVADDTIVFYYGDHGGVLARSKRYLFDSGTRVPLIVRFPDKWQDLAPASPGSRLSRPVSFVDFGPTVMSLAGLDVPDHMEGRAFLGEHEEPTREYAYLFRGRMDERYDMMRAVRGRRYLYIRNYMPHRVYGQHLRYLWRAQSTRAWQEAYRQGECNEVQSRFWETKPPEELYLVREDPHNVNNLADDPDHQPVLKQMRRANLQHVREIRDVGYLPEAEMLRRAEKHDCSPYELAERADFPLERIIDTAEKATSRDMDHFETLLDRMDDPDSGVRYWAATGCAVLSEGGEHVSKAAPKLQKRLEDDAPDVRVTAAEALCRMGLWDEGLAALRKALAHDRNKVALRAVNVVQSLGEDATSLLDAVREAQDKGSYVERAAKTALETLG